MRSNDQVISKLLRYVNGQFKKDANYDIALTILTHYSQIPTMTINDLADLCYSSTASVSRFIRLLDYDSYTDFKDACKNTLQISKTDYSIEASKATKEDVEPIFKNYTNHVLENIQYVYDCLDYDQIDAICQKIKESKEIVFLGLEFSTMLGEHFQNRMALMNKYIQLGISHHEQLEISENIKPGTVVIIATIEGGYFYRNDDVINNLVEGGAYIVALTMNKNNKLMRNANEIVLCSKGNSDTEGRISLLYCIELIIMYYFINFSYY